MCILYANAKNTILQITSKMVCFAYMHLSIQKQVKVWRDDQDVSAASKVNFDLFGDWNKRTNI